MGKVIYGVDLSKKITPIIVRDAMIRCFTQAHKEVLDTMDEFAEWESEEERQKLKRMGGELVVKKTFDDANVSFEKPTKKGLIKVLERLVKYASNFRKQDIILKHYNEIKLILDKCEC